MKSYVGIGQTFCPICLEKKEAILLDRRLKDTLKPNNFLGFEFCEKHQKQIDDDYIFLIETKEEIHDLKEVDKRTGNYAALKRELAKKIFNVPKLEDINFVEIGVIDKLQEITEQDEEE